MKKIYSSVLSLLLSATLLPIPVITAGAEGAAVENPVVTVQDEVRFQDEFENGYIPVDYTVDNAEWVDSGKASITDGSLKKNISSPIDVWDGTADTSWYSDTKTSYDITTAEQLAGVAYLANAMGKNFNLMTLNLKVDIDLANKPWAPIGGGTSFATLDTTCFKGTFNGNGHIIRNLTLNTSTEFPNSATTTSQIMAYGFFGNLFGATVTNLGIEGIKYVDDESTGAWQARMGGLAGKTIGATISGVYIKGLFLNRGYNSRGLFGGLIGFAQGAEVTQTYISGYDVNRTRQDQNGAMAVMYAGINLTDCYVTGNRIGGNTAAGFVVCNAAQYVTDNAPSAVNCYSSFVQSASGSPLQNKSLNENVTYSATNEQITTGLVKAGSKFRADTGNVNGGAPVFKSTEDKLYITASVDTTDATSATLSAQSLGSDVFNIALPAGESEYDVKVVLDKTTMKYTTYINGTENASLSGTFTNNYTYINNITVTAEGTATVDNLSLCTPTENADTIVAEINAEMPSDLDYVYQDFTIPESVGGYDIEWTASDDVIEIENGEALVARRYYTQKVKLTATINLTNNASSKANSQIKVEYNITVPAVDGIDDPDTILDDIEQYYLTDELITDEELTAITKNLKTLPTELDDVTFEWSVPEDQNVLTADGTVTRPEADTADVPVTLTVDYGIGDVRREKVYELVITAPLTTEGMLDLAWQALTEESVTDQPKGQIRNNIALPSTGLYGTTITWTSSDPDVIAINGGVTRTTTDEEVCLTATLELNGVEADEPKELWFIVERTAQTKANEDFDAIVLTEGEVASDFSLPLLGTVNTQTIEWTSDNSAIAVSGNRAVVTRPAAGSGDAEVTLTAKIVCEEKPFTRTFEFTVPQMPTDAEILAECMEGIDITTITAEDPTGIRENLALPQAFPNGITCTWSVLPEGAVDPVTGVIARPEVGEEAITATLTPTLTKGSATLTGEPLSVTILAFDEPAEVLRKAKSELTFNAISDDPIDLVAEDLTLPLNWRYGTTIEWSSNDGVHLIVKDHESDPSIKIGEVNRPGYLERGVDVELTATLSYGGETATKTFAMSISEMAGNQSSAYYDFEDTTLEEQITKRKLLTEPGSSFDLELVENPDEAGDTVLAMKRYSTHTSTGQLRWETSVRAGIMVFDVDMKLEDVPTSGIQVSAAFTPGGTTRLITKILADGSVIANNDTYAGAVPTDRWFNYQIWADIPNWEYWVVADGVRLNAEPLPLNGDATGLTFWVYEMAWTNNVTRDHTLLLDDWYVYRYVDYSEEFTDAVERFELAFLSQNDISAVTGDLVIPTVDSDSIKTILTTSSDATAITNGGSVTRSNVDRTVQFTVDFTNVFGGTRQKVYNIIVKGFNYTGDGDSGAQTPVADDLTAVRTDMAKVESDLKKNYNISQITGNMTLPTSGANGTTITWSSSDSAISNTGVVTRSNTAKTVTLTYVVERNSVRDVGTIDVTVAAQIGTPVVIPQGGGSVTVDRGNISTAPSAPVATVAPVKKTTFTDVPKTFWGYDAIEALYDKGVIDGVGDGKFDTASTVTREALVKMILLALDIEVPETTQSSFADLNASDWSLSYVEAAYANGIVSGIGDGKFGKGNAISRQDICVIIYRALSARGLIEPTESSAFADSDKVSDYAKEAASALKAAGIVNGDDDNMLNPTANATRAEAAQFIYNCIEYMSAK